MHRVNLMQYIELTHDVERRSCS